jgi:hypothetical protein
MMQTRIQRPSPKHYSLKTRIVKKDPYLVVLTGEKHYLSKQRQRHKHAHTRKCHPTNLWN